MEERLWDVIIAGAGPAGTACALGLRDSDLKVLLIDRAEFPRDKVCGDAIPGLAKRELQRLHPGLARQLDALPEALTIRGARIAAPNGRQADIRFSGSGYCCKRLDFDHFLLKGVREHTSTDVLTGVEIRTVSRTPDCISVSLADGRELRSKLILGADGAHSRVKAAFQSSKIDRSHHIAAVRAYFRNVSEVPEDMMEIRMEAGVLPGYFWLFPLPDGWVNVGLGMLSANLPEGIGLKQLLSQTIAGGKLGERFRNAEPVGEVTGFGLPLGSLKRELSGERFLLAGDAGGLIDPATGEGIGNAMLSGRLAAEQMLKAIHASRFDAGFLAAYDQAVYDRLWKEFRRKYRVQKWFAGNPRWVNLAVGIAAGSPLVRNLIRKMF